MKRKLFQKFNNQEGSATIEATVAFTAFLLVIFTLLSLVNLCRAQMLISSAMDNAAKELSQYSYFYKMSGLQKFSKAMNDKADAGKAEINEVIGSVDDLYSSMVGAIDKTGEGYTNIAEATKEGTLDINTFKEAYDGLSGEAENVGSNIDNMAAQFESIGDNPMLYMKSLVAIASTEGLDLVKSHAIAAPLAKYFVCQQFGKTADEASKNLETLGVKDGLSGMNFKMSTIFSSEHEEDVRLVVYYKLTLLQLFDWDVLEVNMYKQSACRAWLAGDNPPEFELEDNLGTEDGEKDSETSETEEPSDTDETENPEANPDSTEGTTEPNEEKVDLTNSKWTSGTYSEGVPYLYHMSSQYGLVLSAPETLQRDKPTTYGDSCSMTKAEDSTDALIFADVVSNLQAIGQYVEAYDEDDVDRVLIYEVFVPENISEEDYKKLEDEIDEAEFLIDMAVESYNKENNPNGNPIAQNVEYDIKIKKVGGNYDYSGGGK